MANKSIGSDLKSAREAAGLTLDHVAEKSKLRKSLILAIEEDDFSLCGGEVYARGHIRVLATLYRIDSSYLIEEFDKTFGVAKTTLNYLAQRTSKDMDRGFNLSWKALSGVAAVTLFVAVIASNQLPSNQEVVAAPESSVSPPSPTFSPSESQSLPVVASVDEGVTVRLTVVKSYSWISVTAADGTSLFTGQIKKGEVREFIDPQVLRLVIGNAGAVSMSVNGVDRGISGRIGEVVRLEFTPDDENSQG
jgi:cytoskeletal protein RodZ